MDRDLVKASKFLSLVLRHDPAAAGVTLDQRGWTELDALIAGAQAAGVGFDRERLATIMAESEKARFELSPDASRIRAVHGHSVDVEAHGASERPPQSLWHGTADRFLDAILREGLKAGDRRFVHLSADSLMARAVGAPRTARRAQGRRTIRFRRRRSFLSFVERRLAHALGGSALPLFRGLSGRPRIAMACARV